MEHGRELLGRLDQVLFLLIGYIRVDGERDADALGAHMQEPAETAADIGAEKLREGLLMWAGVDFPWLHMVDGNLFGASLDGVRSLSPELILSHHLPPARDMTAELSEYLAEVPGTKPFAGPDQQAFQTMLGEAEGT